jgi:tryptophanase
MERGACRLAETQRVTTYFQSWNLFVWPLLDACIPNAHMNVTAESVMAAWEQRRVVTGLCMAHERVRLRFFQAIFSPLVACAVLPVDTSPEVVAN